MFRLASGLAGGGGWVGSAESQPGPGSAPELGPCLGCRTFRKAGLIVDMFPSAMSTEQETLLAVGCTLPNLQVAAEDQAYKVCVQEGRVAGLDRMQDGCIGGELHSAGNGGYPDSCWDSTLPRHSCKEERGDPIAAAITEHA